MNATKTAYRTPSARFWLRATKINGEVLETLGCWKTKNIAISWFHKFDPREDRPVIELIDTRNGHSVVLSDTTRASKFQPYNPAN